MATMRKWLTKTKFNWDVGVIVYQETVDKNVGPGDIGHVRDVKKPVKISAEHSVLNEEFYDGFGCPEAPRIIAQDDKYIYFITNYDGSTTLRKIPSDVRTLIDTLKLIPYF